MMSIKDWVLSQLLSNSLSSARPLSGSDSFFEGECPANDFSVHGSTQTTNSSPPEVAADISRPSVPNQETPHPSPLRQVTFENPRQHHHTTNEKNLDPLAKIEMLQIKFLRFLLRLNHPLDDLMVAKVLYRIHLATLIRSAESDLKKVNLSSDKAKQIAVVQETSGVPELNFTFTILVLGKTGVGKSSTINSILNQAKAKTNAFQPATDRVQEVVGTVNGIKISFIDTPGLLPPSPNTIGRNRKILHKIKKRVRKSPPDMVLYFERFDMININYSDFPLLKLITEVFGTGIWFNTMIVMTHSCSPLPEGPNGYSVTYKSYCTQCTDLIQHYIHQAVSDSKLENPFLFVENHPQCRTNINGDKILPNGQIWKSQFLLSCLCTKILGDVNKVLDFQDRIELGGSYSNRMPSLPHLLSSFLQHHISNPNLAKNEIDYISISDLEDEEEEYDQLPPIRILTKSQFKKLTNSQKNDYLDELDYRETLYLKKQIKEELRARKKNVSENGNLDGDKNSDPPEPVLLPDMTIPPSFDSDNPLHRYRSLVTSDQWLARPVLDPHGWDHDVGFDGINLESASKVSKNLYASVTGQISKDKQDLNVQSECCAAFVDPRGPTYSAALDVQSSDKELIYTLHGNTKVRVLERNTAECGVSLMSFGNNYYAGAKLEDSFLVGNRVKFVVNGGQMRSREQVAYGGSLQTVIRGRDYPVRNDKVSLTMTVLSMNKETVLGGNIESDFRVGRGTNMSINANINNRNMGQLTIKTSSSEHLEIALIAAASILRVLFRRLGYYDGSIKEHPEVG